jgi:hypothetical protein
MGYYMGGQPPAWAESMDASPNLRDARFGNAGSTRKKVGPPKVRKEVVDCLRETPA